jgi:retron-type reverse transcriptase
MTSGLNDLHLAVDSVLNHVKKSFNTGFDSINVLRDLARDCANSVRGGIIEVAEETNRSPLSVVRNLVATCPSGKLPLLRTLIEFWQTHDPFEPSAKHVSLLAALPTAGRRNDLFRWLVLDDKPPRIEEVVGFGDGSPLPVLAIMMGIRKHSPPTGSGNTVSILRAIMGHQDFRFSESDRQVILADGFQMSLSPLDQAAFEKLQVRGRRWVLQDRNFSQAVLTSDFHDFIWSEPLAYPDTPEAIQVWTWNHRTLPTACRALRERNFSSSELAVLLNRGDVGDYSELMLASIQDRRNVRTWIRQSDLSLPPGILDLVGKRLGNALTFFSRPVAKRLSVIDSLSPEETEELKFDVSPANWLEAIWRCELPSTLRLVRDLTLKDTVFRRNVFKGMTRGGLSAQCFEFFVLDFMREADAAGLQLLVSKVPSAFNLWQPQMFGGSAFREVIAAYCSTPKGFAALEKHALDSLLECLFKGSDEWIQNWRRNLALRSGSSRVASFRQRARYHLFGSCPELIGGTTGWKISRTDFAVLLAAVLTKKERAVSAELLSFAEPSGKPCWERFFNSSKYGENIRNLIKRERPALSSRLAELDAAALLADKTFRKKLMGILRGRTPRATLGVPRLVQRKMIPWIRKKWRAKPTLAVAYELALAFSLRDSRYLVSLCATRWQSSDKDRGGHAFDHLYRTYSLPKKSGGSRLVTVPNDALKRLQRRILRNGFDDVLVHSAAHGFKRGRSIVTNALPHVGKACVVNVDIESFFPSTRYPLIFRACSQLMDGDLSEGACHVLADICSFGGGLPTGAPTSPAVANLVLRPADAAITKAATDNYITYTRYADDLTFSGDTNTIKILPFVKRILTQLGYQLKEKKTNIFRRGRRQMVTGLVVNEKPNLPRRLRRRLRAAVHQMTKDGNPQWQGHPMSSNELLGRLAFLNLVQPEEAQALKLKMKGPK